MELLCARFVFLISFSFCITFALNSFMVKYKKICLLLGVLLLFVELLYRIAMYDVLRIDIHNYIISILAYSSGIALCRVSIHLHKKWKLISTVKQQIELYSIDII